MQAALHSAVVGARTKPAFMLLPSGLPISPAVRGYAGPVIGVKFQLPNFLQQYEQCSDKSMLYEDFSKKYNAEQDQYD